MGGRHQPRKAGEALGQGQVQIDNSLGTAPASILFSRLTILNWSMTAINLPRRRFLSRLSLGMLGGLTLLTPRLAGDTRQTSWDPDRPFPQIGRPLRVQPVFMYRLPTQREQASWKSWGGIQTAAAVEDECGRIAGALRRLADTAAFPIEFLPLARVDSVDAAARLADTAADVTLLYPCTGSADLLRACLGIRPDVVLFVRRTSGPIYYWYQALSVRHLDTTVPGDAGSPGDAGTAAAAHVEDVVVDDETGIEWRLRALFAVKNLRGSRIVALGGAWGKYAPDAPRLAEERYGFKILDVSYDEFEPRLRRARADRGCQAGAAAAADRFLALPGTVLETDRGFVTQALLLHQLFRELLEEQDASVFTIKSCMGTIIPMSETTACLSLALLNDEGPMAFCESDFVIIPAGILLRYIAGRPVFLHNSTFPDQGSVTCAHCTCPRRLDGRTYAPARILTHYESEYGAAPKVEMPIGQAVSFINPEYSTARWLGFTGKIEANPDYAICRSQQDVRIDGDWRRLIGEVRDSHWVMAYGNHLNSIGYALRKLGLQWVNLSGHAG